MKRVQREDIEQPGYPTVFQCIVHHSSHLLQKIQRAGSAPGGASGASGFEVNKCKLSRGDPVDFLIEPDIDENKTPHIVRALISGRLAGHEYRMINHMLSHESAAINDVCSYKPPNPHNWLSRY